jgi:hypothetical protein
MRAMGSIRRRCRRHLRIGLNPSARSAARELSRYQGLIDAANDRRLIRKGHAGLVVAARRQRRVLQPALSGLHRPLGDGQFPDACRDAFLEFVGDTTQRVQRGADNPRWRAACPLSRGGMIGAGSRVAMRYPTRPNTTAWVSVSRSAASSSKDIKAISGQSRTMDQVLPSRFRSRSLQTASRTRHR